MRPFGRRGFYASFTLQGVQAGQILAAAVFLPLAAYMPTEAFNAWGWRIPFLLSFFVIVAGYIIRREVEETPAFAEEGEQGDVPQGADRPGFPARTGGHAAGRLHGADERHSRRRDHLRRGLCGAAGLRHRLSQGRLSVDPGARQHAWPCSSFRSSAICPTRSAASLRSSSARSASGLLAFAYLYAISIHNVPLAIFMSLLMWGVVYQGYNAIFPSFYPELFPTRDPGLRDGDLAERRNDDHGAAPGPVRHRRASRLDQYPADGRRDRLRHHGDRGRWPP